MRTLLHFYLYSQAHTHFADFQHALQHGKSLAKIAPLLKDKPLALAKHNSIEGVYGLFPSSEYISLPVCVLVLESSEIFNFIGLAGPKSYIQPAYNIYNVASNKKQVRLWRKIQEYELAIMSTNKFDTSKIYGKI